MGGMNSYFIRCCVSPNNCPENHCKIKIQSNRSFTFNTINDDECPLESPDFGNNNYTASGLININSASEDALMTLPGINRKVAHDIIRHRKKIVEFKNIEDIALVNGIGADKFKLIKSEISIEPTEEEVNEVLLNQIDIFQLTKIPGFTQTLAERIVYHREKRGPFKTIKDFLKVPGINSKLLRSIKPKIRFSMDLSHRKSDVISVNKTLSDDNRSKSSTSAIEFDTQLKTEFELHINILKIDITKDDTLTESLDNYLIDKQPTLIFIMCSDTNNSSIDIIQNRFNEKYGLDYFIYLECNAGDNCLHNNEKFKLKVLSNFHSHSRSVSLCSLNEDMYTCMVLSMQVENRLIYMVALFDSTTIESKNQNEEIILLNDIAIRLNSDNENYFVFLCDLSLMKLAYTVFLNNGLSFDDEFINNSESRECAVTGLWKTGHSHPNLQLKLKEKTSETVNNVFIQKFDVIVQLS